MSSERRRIASAATLILVAYGLSRVLGAVRELVIANTFGTSHQIDDYRVAFGVPDLLFNLLLAGAISSAFIPVLSEHLAKGEQRRALEIAQRVLNSAIVILTVGAAVLFLVDCSFSIPDSVHPVIEQFVNTMAEARGRWGNDLPASGSGERQGEV